VKSQRGGREKFLPGGNGGTRGKGENSKKKFLGNSEARVGISNKKEQKTEKQLALKRVNHGGVAGSREREVITHGPQTTKGPHISRSTAVRQEKG